MTALTVKACCIIKQSEVTGKKTIFKNCDNIEEAISIINNQTFKRSPLNEGAGLTFTSHTSNNLYSIIEGNHNSL